jgi:spore coat protein CotF
LVHVVHGLGVAAAVPYRPGAQAAQYSAMPAVMQQGIPAATMQHGMPAAAMQHGLQPAAVQPNLGAAQIDDRDVGSAMLSTYKSAARLKLNAALECANLPLRNLLLQGAANCVHQAYEAWGYLNSRGFYPLTNLQDAANAQLLRGYQPMPTGTAPSQEAYRSASTSPAAFTETVFTNGYANGAQTEQGRQTAASPTEILPESDDSARLAKQTDGAPNNQAARKRSTRSAEGH